MTLPGPAVLTGATGFVGSRLRPLLGEAAALPLADPGWRERIDAAPLEDAVVFHLAARVHRPADGEEATYREDNVEKSAVLARAAARRGARHLVFLSSAKVLGEESVAPLAPAAPYAPRDAYARSKRAAEEALREISAATGLAVTIVRSPLVYGAGARGNLAALVRLCDGGWPLPFGAVRNRRSWIHVDDLAALLAAAAVRAGGASATFHAAHPQPVGTAALVAGLRQALARPRRLVPVPPFLLESAAVLAGRGDAMRRLTRSLELDASATASELGWTPRRNVEQALADLVRRAPA